MSTLISGDDLLSITDAFAAWGDVQKAPLGRVADSASPVAGSAQAVAKALCRIVTAQLDDIKQVIDLGQSVSDFFATANWEATVLAAKTPLKALDLHCQTEGGKVNTSISSIASYLAYLNTTPFSYLANPGYADVHLAVFGARPPAAGVMQPSLHPDFNSSVSQNGMGKRAVGGSLQAGTAPNIALYSAPLPLIEIVTDFSGGATHPSVTLAGVDHAGATTTWTATLGTDNPTAAVSTTLSGAVVAGARQDVGVADATGIIRGSILTIDPGLPSEEMISVDAISGSTLTFVAYKTHDNGATVEGYATVQPTPAAGARIRSLTGITINVGTHSAGAVRVFGRLDRVARPDAA